jgi:pyruvate dehydrogenase E1 component alpha subunit
VAVDQVDGNDVEAVHAAAARAVADIRADGRPRFLELVTYRMRGHYEPDDQSYVDPAEIERWRQRDPIRLDSTRLVAEGVVTPAALAAMERLVATRIDDAAAFAQASPWPSPQALTEHVYA